MLAVVPKKQNTPPRLRLLPVNDRPHLNDNPSDHDVLITLVERMNQYISNTNATLRRLEDKVDTMGHLRGDVDRALLWQSTHDQHHGLDDSAIARRIGPVLGWRVFAGAVALGAALASIIGVVITVSAS
jgi:hypothetical protein